MNYIGFYKNIYQRLVSVDKNISWSLKYEKNIKENLEEISEFLLDIKNKDRTKFIILMNNIQELNEKDKKFVSLRKEKNIDFIFVKQNQNKYLTNEKITIRELFTNYIHLYNHIDKKILCSKKVDRKFDSDDEFLEDLIK